MSESYKVYASQEYVDNKFNDVSDLPEGAKPNQYLVTDSEGDVKWEDKLAWSESSEEVILPVCQPEYSEEMDGMSIFTEEREIGFTVGTEYIVNWNGTEYVCVAKETANGDVYLGNGVAFTGDDSGDPFMVAVVPSIGLQFIDFNGSTTLTISIRRVSETIHKMSGKLIEGMGYTEAGHPLFTLELEDSVSMHEQKAAIEAQGYVFQQTNMQAFALTKNIGAIDLKSLVGAKLTVCAGAGDPGKTEIVEVTASDISGDALVSHNMTLTASGDLTIEITTNAAFYPGSFVGSLTPNIIHPIDKKYLPSSSGLPSGSSPNQYLVTDGEGNAKWEDKLCWSGKAFEDIVWDGNTDGHEVVVLSPMDTLVKVSDAIIQKEWIVGATATSVTGETVVIGESNVIDLDIGFFVIGGELGGLAVVALEDGEMEGKSLTKGTWFSLRDVGFNTAALSSPETIHPIDKKYLRGNTIFFVQSSTQGQGDYFLYRTEDGANNYDEAQRVTKSELEAAFFAGAISVKDISIKFYFMPSYVRFDRQWGEMMINDVFVCRTAEYVEEEG